MPHDPDLLRRDLLNVKAMRFNAIRFIAGVAKRYQLDLCDELGLMVYEESYAGWCLADSPKMAERYDESVAGMIRRDRNHPSVVIWGLLNETPDGPVFRHAVGALSLVRSLDDTRMVMLGSGRWDGQLDLGSLCNPGSQEWERLLGAEAAGAEPTRAGPVGGYWEQAGDVHAYPRVPHTAETIAFLRGLGEGTGPVFLSEYGIGSAVDLVRVVAMYEQLGKGDVEDAALYRDFRDRFLEDWERWGMEEAFASPEDYFRACLAKMAGQRLLGLNAIRANPNLVGYSLTGTVDQGWTGEGLTTTFREFKPGTMDAMADGLAPLRLCIFAEPANVYRGSRVRIEVVLADEGVLRPGEYPLRVLVVGPGQTRVMQRRAMVTVPETSGRPEPPFAVPVFAEEVVVDGPAGEYRCLAVFEQGAAAAGGEARFYVGDAAEAPKIETEVTLWGRDPVLAAWLDARGVGVRPYRPGAPGGHEVILVGEEPEPPGGERAFRELTDRISRGASAVFLSPEVFAEGDDPVAGLSLAAKGRLVSIVGWLYLKDEWAKAHPIFEGLPAGGLMDYTFYREIIPDALFQGQEPPLEAVAGAIKASQGYDSGLMMAVYGLGVGRFAINTLLVRENLGTHPAADRLLVNMLRHAARRRT